MYVLDHILLQMLRKIGANVDRALEVIGIRTNNNKTVQLSENEYIEFMETIRMCLPDEDGVLRIINMHNIESVSAPSFAAMCSCNGLEFLERFIRYKHLVCPLAFSRTETKGATTLHVNTLSGQRLPQFLEEIEASYIISLLRKATSHDVVPVKICMSHHVKSKALIDFYGIEPTLTDGTEITISKEDLSRPFLTYNESMWNCLRPGLDRQLFDSNDHSSFIKQVRHTICRQITGGNCTLESTAEMLCLSSRSLQRKLSEHRLKFNEMVAGARHELARVYLANPDMTAMDISYMLGFKEYNSFLRAFRKWEGKGVTEYRRQLSL